MKLKLLFVAFLLCVGNAFAQATAYPVPNIQQCYSDGPNAIDLTAQTPIVIGNQDPANVVVTYFNTEADAEFNANAIPNSSAQEYFSIQFPSTSTIAIRVTSTVDGSFDVTTFTISWQQVTAVSSSDVIACDSYVLPALPVGNTYYNLPGGPTTPGNVILTPNLVLTTSQWVYIFAQSGTCTDENSFTVTITPTLVVNAPGNVTVCDSYVLPALTAGNYYTNPGGPTGGGVMIPAGTAITTTQTIYIYAQNGNLCSDEASFTVTIMPLPLLETQANVVVCESYTLPPLLYGNYYTGSWGTGTQLPEGMAITSTQTIYVYVQSGQCSNQKQFTVTIISNGMLPPFEDIAVCNSYDLPALSAGNYYSGPNGTGTMLYPGMIVTVSQMIYVYAQVNGCTGEGSFYITVNPLPNINDINDVFSCDNYTLPVLSVGNYFTQSGGAGTPLFAGVTITSTQDVYVYAINESGCYNEIDFTVTIGSSPYNLAPVTVCEDDTLLLPVFNLMPAVDQIQNGSMAEVTFFHSYADALANINPITNITAYSPFATTEILYVKADNIDCFSISELTLAVIDCNANTISGTVTYDYDGNGCDAEDTPASNILMVQENGNYVNYTFTDAQGNYSFINVPNGSNSVHIQFPVASQFNATPNSATVTVPGGTNTNFCLTIPQPVNDVLVYFWPLSNAVPGFIANYTINYQNYGTSAASGEVTLQYDAAKLTFIPAPGITQSGNILTIDYTDLSPFAAQYINVSFTVATPPLVNSGTMLAFTASITPLNGDAYPDNNTYAYNQSVVNSYDPNDISVNEGAFITEAQADGYLHYTIRFQNTGTANAVNVKVNTALDANLDWSTFEPIGASHTYQANRSGGNAEFLFNNIQLPYEGANEPGSHGSLSYRIKPKATVTVGDIMAATANIYFDFNAAIVTNTVTTTVQNSAGVKDFTANGFVLYPNPASGKVNLQIQNSTMGKTDITVTDVLGKTVLTQTIQGTQATLDIATLKSGMYFVTLKADGKQLTKKLVVE